MRHPRILLAPASFKGTLSAEQAAAAMAQGVHEALPGIHAMMLPLADGGEGLVSVLQDPLQMESRTTRVRGPLPGQTVDAAWAFSPGDRTAVIEMAAASGLPLVPLEQRNPGRTSTFGVGELLLAALDAGARTILLGLGGSATNDGGAGMAEALGVRFLDAAGVPLPPGGEALQRLHAIDPSGLDTRLRDVSCTAVCDVNNPLTGPEGASVTFARQKGATDEQIPRLDAALERLATIIERDCGVSINGLPGTGAAGGMGAGVVAFCGGALRPGTEIVLDAVGFDRHLEGAMLVVTGEGRLDATTGRGKVIHGVLRRAHKAGVPVVAVVGGVEESSAGAVASLGLAGLETLVAPDTPLAVALQHAEPLVARRTSSLLRRFLLA